MTLYQYKMLRSVRIRCRCDSLSLRSAWRIRLRLIRSSCMSMGIRSLLFLIITSRPGFHQAAEKPGVPLAGLIVSDSHAKSLLLADHDQKFPGPRDARVDQVSLEQHEVLHGHRDHHRRKLGTLRLVDRNRVGQRDLIQLAVIVGHQPVIVSDEDLLLNRIDLFNCADVAVEDFLLIVVLSLNDFVANLEPESESFRGGLGLPGRVQGSLKYSIQFAHSDRAAVHWAQNLNVTDRIQS